MLSSLPDHRFEKLRAGEPLNFPKPPSDREEGPPEKAARTIPAHWLELLSDGPKRVVSAPIRISNAIIDGPLDLSYVIFQSGVSLTDSEFTGLVNFAFAQFQRYAVFNRCCFHGAARFRGAHAHADLDMIGVSFAENASFQDLHVDEILDVRASSFQTADFARMQVGKSSLFQTDDQGRPVTFNGDAIFDGARVGGSASFVATLFKADASFDNLSVSGDAFFISDQRGQRVTFGGEARFLGAHILGNASFTGADFRFESSFDGLRVDSDAFFRVDDQGQRATFGGDARFLGIHVAGNAEFGGAEFKGECVFDGMRVDGDALFRTDEGGQRTTFGGDARFTGSQIAGDADFDGAEFRGKANFNGLRVEGDAFFRTDDFGQRTTFEGDGRFLGAQIAGDAQFDGVEFRSEAGFYAISVDLSITFRTDSKGNRATFRKAALFSAATFGADANFTGAAFGAEARFSNSVFKGAARFPSAEFAAQANAVFVGTRFERGAYFESAQFLGDSDFTAAVAERDARFSGARFAGPASFREAHFHSVFFGDFHGVQGSTSSVWRSEDTRPHQATEWKDKIDLRGFTYERIYIHLPDLLPRLSPFDRQPYVELEAALHRSGDDRRADDVYLERRRQERKNRFRSRHFFLWLLDWLYNLVAHYGVAPLRLIIFSLILIGLGAWLFGQPAALQAPRNAPSGSSIACFQVGFERGLAVSVHYFLPMDSPIGSDCEPASSRVTVYGKLRSWAYSFRFWPAPDWYATICLRVAGGVLTGLALATITGLLRRIAQ